MNAQQSDAYKITSGDWLTVQLVLSRLNERLLEDEQLIEQLAARITVLEEKK